MLKSLFYQLKIYKNYSNSEDEALKQWVLKVDTSKSYDKDTGLITKAKLAVDDLNKGNIPNEVNLKAYLALRKKYKPVFDENNKELENPTQKDILSMDSLSLDEVQETIDDRKKSLFKRYYTSIIDIYRSSYQGKLIRPTSSGLDKPLTPTNDFIDDQVDVYSPFDDTGVD
jgi:hypothetical protein